jgi:ribonuclease BN (tRNA processing enzyme)
VSAVASSPALVILGAGTPKPDPDRFGSSYLLDLGGERVLFDCGPGATMKLARAGFAPGQIDRLLFTHHHFDHNADYAAFGISRWDQGADLIPDLRVYGPWPTLEVTERLFGDDGAFAFDIAARMGNPPSHIAHVERGGTLPRKPPRFDVAVLAPDDAVDAENWSVRTARVEHAQPFLDSLAYRIETPAGSIVLSGDTRPCQSLIDLATGADTLVMMCWDEQPRIVASGLDRYLTGTGSAGELAAAAGVRRLVLTHINPRLARDRREHALEQAGEAFKGEILVADELVRLPIAVG